LKEFVETEQLVFHYNDRKKADEKVDKLSSFEQDAQAVSLIQEILKSLPLRVFPVPTSAIEKRALQLDSDHNIARTSFTSYRKLLNELDGRRIILTSRKDGMIYIENVDFETLERYITGMNS